MNANEQDVVPYEEFLIRFAPLQKSPDVDPLLKDQLMELLRKKRPRGGDGEAVERESIEEEIDLAAPLSPDKALILQQELENLRKTRDELERKAREDAKMQANLEDELAAFKREAGVVAKDKTLNRDIRARNRDLQRDLATARRKLAECEKRGEGNSVMAAELREQLAELEGAAAAERDAQRVELERVQGELEAAKEGGSVVAAELREQLAEAAKEKEEIRAELAAALQVREVIKAELEDVRRERDEVQTELGAAVAAKEGADVGSAELESRIRVLEERAADLERQLGAATARVEEAEGEVAQQKLINTATEDMAKTQLDKAEEARARVAELEAELAERNAAVAPVDGGAAWNAAASVANAPRPPVIPERPAAPVREAAEVPAPEAASPPLPVPAKNTSYAEFIKEIDAVLKPNVGPGKIRAFVSEKLIPFRRENEDDPDINRIIGEFMISQKEGSLIPTLTSTSTASLRRLRGILTKKLDQSGGSRGADQHGLYPRVFLAPTDPAEMAECFDDECLLPSRTRTLASVAWGRPVSGSLAPLSQPIYPVLKSGKNRESAIHLGDVNTPPYVIARTDAESFRPGRLSEIAASPGDSETLRDAEDINILSALSDIGLARRVPVAQSPTRGFLQKDMLESTKDAPVYVDEGGALQDGAPENWYRGKKFPPIQATQHQDSKADPAEEYPHDISYIHHVPTNQVFEINPDGTIPIIRGSPMPQQIQAELKEDGLLEVPVSPRGGFARVWDNTIGAVVITDILSAPEATAPAPPTPAVIPYITPEGSFAVQVGDDTLQIPSTATVDTNALMEYLDDNLPEDLDIELDPRAVPENGRPLITDDAEGARFFLNTLRAWNRPQMQRCEGPACLRHIK